ncbi:MAG: hypothetical protein K9G70_14895 [Prolixibacteraceae bacterium]|nr:hypothetical protein [Prolixibacteraceae bacterium]
MGFLLNVPAMVVGWFFAGGLIGRVAVVCSVIPGFRFTPPWAVALRPLGASVNRVRKPALRLGAVVDAER